MTPPITLQTAESIQRTMKIRLLSFNPKIKEILQKMFIKHTTTLNIFSRIDSKRYIDAPIVTTLMVNRMTAKDSMALGNF